MSSSIRWPMIPILATAAVTGCARDYVWVKEGATKVQVEQARAECRRESQRYGFVLGPEQSTRVMTREGERLAEINIIDARREADLFVDCMRAKGFTHVSADSGEANEK